MPYELSFSPEFYDDPDAPFVPGRPYTVAQALRQMPDDEWAEMIEGVFGEDVDPSYVDIEAVMHEILATNTVSNLDSPVEVWIDPEGYYTISVYEQPLKRNPRTALEQTWDDAARLARDAFGMWRNYGPIPLYAIAKRGRVAILEDKDVPPGWILVTAQRLPVDLSREQLTSWLFERLRKTPYLSS